MCSRKFSYRRYLCERNLHSEYHLTLLSGNVKSALPETMALHSTDNARICPHTEADSFAFCTSIHACICIFIESVQTGQFEEGSSPVVPNETS